MFNLFKKLNSKGEWRKVSELSVGMEIAVPKDGLLDEHRAGSLEAREDIAGDDVFWDEIVEIRHVGEERVYDIEVEKTHNFVGNNIFAHNTFTYAALFEGGKVGIGTTTPATQLALTGSPTVDPFEISSTSGVSLLRFTQGGNLGIGTTTPQQPLVVIGSTTISSLTAGLVRTTDTGGLYTDTNTYLQSADLADYVQYSYGSSTYATILAYPTYTYASSTFPSFTYASSTFATILNYPTYTYGSSTYVNFSYASSTFADILSYPSYTYASSTYVNYGYGSSTYATILNYPTYSYASSTFSTYAYGSSTYVSFGYASSTFPSFTYASSTYAQASSFTGTNGKVARWSSASALTSGILLDNGTVAGVNATNATTTLLVTGSGTLNPFAVASSTGANLLTVTPSGNVGIGTASPGGKLHVDGGILVVENGAFYSSAQKLVFAADGFPSSYYHGITTTHSDVADANNLMKFTVSNAASAAVDVMSLTGAGNVGIGTTTPAQLLSVAGNMRLTGALFDYTNASGTLGMVLKSTGTGTEWVATSTLGITGGSGVSGGTNGYVARFTAADALSAGILLDNGTVAGVNATSSSYTFNIQGASGTSPFNISSSTGTSLVTVDQRGYVGIGTAGPSQKLEVNGKYFQTGAGGTAGDINTGSAGIYSYNGAGRYIRFNTNGGANDFLSAGAAMVINWSGGQNVEFFGSTAATAFVNGNLSLGGGAFDTAASTRTLTVQAGTAQSTTALLDVKDNGGTNHWLYVKGDGNVGIGTTTPAQLLSVAGNMRLTGALFDYTNASGTLGMVLKSTGTGTEWVATSTLGITGGSGVSGGTNGYVARFTAADALSAGILLDNGTVAGVNATSSSYTFNIQGASATNPFNIASSTGTSLVTVDQRGYVGIGTTGPGGKLHVDGGILVVENGAFYSSAQKLVFAADGFPSSYYHGITTTHSDVADANNLMKFTVSNAASAAVDVMSLTGAGNVGIGTTTPAQLLSVAGNMRLTGALFDYTNASGTLGMVLKSTGTGTEWVATSTLGITGGSGVSGGTNGYVARFTAADALSTGILLDNGTVAGVNATSSTVTFNVQGNAGNISPFTVASSTGTSMFDINARGSTTIASLATGIVLSNSGSLNTIATLNVARGGTGTTSSPTLAGQLLGAHASGSYGIINLIAGSNITITTSTPGQISIASTGGSGSSAWSLGPGVIYNATSTDSVGIGTSTPAGKLVIQGTGAVNQSLLTIASSSAATLLDVSWYGGLVQNISSTTAVSIQNGSGSAVFEIDTTQSDSNAGLDITAGGSQTGNLLNLYSSGGSVLSAFTYAGGFVQNISSTTAVQILNGSGSMVFEIDTVGKNIRLATTASTSIASILTNEGDFAIGDDGTAGSTSGRIWIRSRGTTFRFNSTGNSADYSEFFYQINTSTPGMVMSSDNLSGYSTTTLASTTLPSDTGVVKKSAKAYDPGILGVITTRGTGNNNPDDDRQFSKNYANVGLLGHVATKVTDENGEVKAGDFITSSARFPGYAMRATRSGQIIGKALADFNLSLGTTSPTSTLPHIERLIDPETGAASTITAMEIMTFVRPSYQILNNSFVFGEDDGQLSTATSTQSTVHSSSSPASFLVNQMGSGNLLQLQQAGVDRLVIGNSGSVSILANIPQGEDVLTVKNSSTTLFSISSVGNVTTVGHLIVGKDTAGTAVINAGDDQVAVTFETPYATIPKVVVTAQGVPNFFYGVVEKTEQGFIIRTSVPVEEDFSFDWIALAQPEESTFASGKFNLTVTSTPQGQGSITGGSGTSDSTSTPADGSVAGTSSPETIVENGTSTPETTTEPASGPEPEVITEGLDSDPNLPADEPAPAESASAEPAPETVTEDPAPEPPPTPVETASAE